MASSEASKHHILIIRGQQRMKSGEKWREKKVPASAKKALLKRRCKYRCIKRAAKILAA